MVCPKCGQPLPTQSSWAEEIVACGTCQRDVEVLSFPDRAASVAVKSRDALAGEPTCFFCPHKAAHSSCESCGRYVCGDCTADWFGQQLCLACVHAQREVKGDLTFRSRVTLYDNIALMLMLLPLFVVPFYGVFFSAMASPFSLYLAIRHRKASRGIVPRGPGRTISAIVLAALFLLGGCGLVGFIAWSIAEGSDSGPWEAVESPTAVDEEAPAEEAETGETPEAP